MRRRVSRRGLDEWFGTIAHYSGLGLLFYGIVIDKFRNPAIIPAATGLIFLRNVTGSGGNGGSDGRNGNGRDRTRE